MLTAGIWSKSKLDVEFQYGGRMTCHPRATCHIAGCCHLANSMSWSRAMCHIEDAATERIQRHVIPEPRITLQGAATWWIHCHVPRFTEPHATLQGAVTWRNQWHDRATLQGVRIPSAILKIVFRHILFFWFLMQFRLWRAAAFVSSPIHLLILAYSIFKRLLCRQV